MYVSPNSYFKILTPNVIVLEANQVISGALMNDTGTLKKGPQRALSHSVPKWGYSLKARGLQPRIEILLDSESVGALILDILALGTMKNKFLLLISYPTNVTLL